MSIHQFLKMCIFKSLRRNSGGTEGKSDNPLYFMIFLTFVHI